MVESGSPIGQEAIRVDQVMIRYLGDAIGEGGVLAR